MATARCWRVPLTRDGVPPACDDSCSGVLLNDLEDVDVHLGTVNISRLVVASFLQLAELENRSREVQVTAQHCPPLEAQQCSNDALSVAGAGCRRRCSL